MTDLEKERQEDRIRLFPLERAFPQPDYNALLKQGVNPKRVALMHAIRDDLPPKPIPPFHGKAGLSTEIEIMNAVLRDLKEDLSCMNARTEKYTFSQYAKHCIEITESGFKDYCNRKINNYVDKVAETLDWSKRVLFNESLTSALTSAALNAREKNVHPASTLHELGHSSQVEASIIFCLANGAQAMTLRMNLYEHYGHDVSFKPLCVKEEPPAIKILENRALTNSEKLINYRDYAYDSGEWRLKVRTEPTQTLILQIRGANDAAEQNSDMKIYFTRDELREIVRSPEIQKWYENELEKTNEKSKEQENEKEEDLEEDLDNGMSY